MCEITINEDVGFGRPCIKGTRIPAEIVYERFCAGETIIELMLDYGLNRAQIQAAIKYEEVVNDR